MIRYARIVNQYKYEMQKRPNDGLWPRDGNLGDCIQSLAVENIYKKAGVATEELLFVNRDDINKYDGEKCRLAMQSWFGDYANIFALPWTEKITPIFIGFHLNAMNHTRERFFHEEIHKKMKPYEPIGCRDRSTRDFLQALGVNAYFSACMTLTFDERNETPKDGKTFIVDLDKKVAKKMPKHILKKADHSITHFYYWNEYPVSEKGAKEFEDHARQTLERYKNEASLIITSKIHVAMPSIAMGIPVIFITDNLDNERFDVLKGILPLYTYKDIKRVNWNPKKADISELKKAITENAIAQISGINVAESANKLNSVTNNLKCVNFLPKHLRFIRWVRSFFSKSKRRALRISFMTTKKSFFK